MHDLRLAIRALCAAPLVSVAAIVSLAVGIGANTAVFSIVNAILLKAAPYPEPDRLVLLGYTFSGASVPLVSETKLNVWNNNRSYTFRWRSCSIGRAPPRRARWRGWFARMLNPERSGIIEREISVASGGAPISSTRSIDEIACVRSRQPLSA